MTEVTIFTINLDEKTTPGQAALYNLLSSDERARADRFRFDHHRHQYIASHAALRILLARELGTAPEQIHYTYSPEGKPHLDGVHTAADLHFSLAHAHQIAAVALCSAVPVGIDLEYLQAQRDIHRIAARFFSKNEAAQFAALPPDQQHEAFYRCWTRKEAFVKALGTGFSGFPFSNFDVTLAPGEPARVLSISNDPAKAAAWSLATFRPAPDYLAALAVPFPTLNLIHPNFTWPQSF